MVTSVRIGNAIYSVNSDEELATLEDALKLLKEKRQLQKEERIEATQAIKDAIVGYIVNYGPICIENENAGIAFDLTDVNSIEVSPEE